MLINNFLQNLTHRFGRKPTYTLCILLLACAVTGSAFSMSLITFCILRLLSGFCNIGLFELYTVWGKINKDRSKNIFINYEIGIF